MPLNMYFNIYSIYLLYKEYPLIEKDLDDYWLKNVSSYLIFHQVNLTGNPALSQKFENKNGR